MIQWMILRVDKNFQMEINQKILSLKRVTDKRKWMMQFSGFYINLTQVFRPVKVKMFVELWDATTTRLP